MITRLVLAVVLIFTLTPLAFGFNGSNRLCWNPSPEADVIGYKLLLGLTSGSYPVVKDVPKATAVASCGVGKIGVTLSALNLSDGAYYAVVRAYDSSGNESANSAEVIPAPFPLDQAPPGVVTGAEVQ
jgi:hypothetical protein